MINPFDCIFKHSFVIEVTRVARCHAELEFKLYTKHTKANANRLNRKDDLQLTILVFHRRANVHTDLPQTNYVRFARFNFGCTAQKWTSHSILSFLASCQLVFVRSQNFMRIFQNPSVIEIAAVNPSKFS